MDLGDHIAGVRSNDAGVVELLRAVLAPQRVDGLAVFPNVSVYVGRRDGATRELHRLYRRGAHVLSTASLGRLVRASLLHLDALRDPPPGLLPLRAEAFVAGNEAVLLSQPWVASVLPDRRWSRTGWRRTDGLPALLDPATAEVVVPEPALALDPDGLRDLDARFPVEDADPPVAPGRYRLRAIVLYRARRDPSTPLTPGQRLAALSVLLPTTSPHPAADLAALGAVADAVEVVPTGDVEPEDLLDILRALGRD